EGLAGVNWGHPSLSGWPDRWQAFVNIVLALSGVEAVANMTGLMKRPVPRTARRTIWPVLAEVGLLNMVFGLALSGLPALVGVRNPSLTLAGAEPGLAPQVEPAEVMRYRDPAARVLAMPAAERLARPKAAEAAAVASGVVFGMLLP